MSKRTGGKYWSASVLKRRGWTPEAKGWLKKYAAANKEKEEGKN